MKKILLIIVILCSFAVSASAQNQCSSYDLSLGDAVQKTVSDHTDPAKPVTNSIMCPAGYAVTTIAYKDAGTLNSDFPDGANAITAKCSKINPDGTISDTTDYGANADIASNPSDLNSFSCPSGSVATAIVSKDFPAGGYSDLWDGGVPGCTAISSTGMGSYLGYPSDPDLTSSPREYAMNSCPTGSVLVGFDYDHFGTTSPDAANIIDSIATLYCQKLVSDCQQENYACNTSSDCGTNGYTGSPYCYGGDVYQDYKTWTCNNPGTSSATCTYSTMRQMQDNCNSNETSHSYYSCYNGNVYWFNSCGNAEGIYQSCAAGQYCSGNSCNGGGQQCSYHSYQRCSGNYLYWFDSCGNQQDIYQYCQNGCYNNSCGYYQGTSSLTVNKTVKNLTANSGWSQYAYAYPSDMLLFMITVQSAGNQDAQNVYVRDSLPANLLYNNQLTVSYSSNYNGNNNNYSNYSGDITSGINLGTVYAGQMVTITYQVQVASAPNFSYGTTTFNNNVYVTSSNTGYTPSNNATVYVNRQAVYGASTISTGWTNNIWTDSFILPLIIALSAVVLWKSGVFFPVEKSLGNLKKRRNAYKSEKELQKRIALIAAEERRP